jgi:membrane protein YqaA with SNARE-associated domain
VAKKPNIIRRLYNWVLHWAETPYGVPALFVLAFAESSFFPIPPDVLLIALAISVPAKCFRFAAVATVGSLLGGIVGYGIGWMGWAALGATGDPDMVAVGLDGGSLLFRYVPGFTPKVFLKAVAAYEKCNVWAVFLAAFSFIPYKVITISAGVCRINFPLFVLISFIGRAGRFLLVAALIRRYREEARAFIDKYFNLLSLAFCILLIGGFVLVRCWREIANAVKSLF